MDFYEYQQKAIATAIYPESEKVKYPALALCGEAGEVANKVKKWMRGDYELTEEKKKEIGKEIGGTLWYIANLANDLGLYIGDIASENIAILESRKERVVIMGDGDNR